jgi:hypothetical protein
MISVYAQELFYYYIFVYINSSMYEWPIMSECVSEWLLFNAKWKNFLPYHGENMLNFNEMMMRSALY